MTVKISPQISSLLGERNTRENTKLIEVWQDAQEKVVGETARRQLETRIETQTLESNHTSSNRIPKARFNLD